MVHIHMSVCIPRYIIYHSSLSSALFYAIIVFYASRIACNLQAKKTKTKNNVCNLFVRAFAKIPTFRFVAAQLPHSAAPSIFAYFPQPTAPQQAITRRCTHTHTLPFTLEKSTPVSFDRVCLVELAALSCSCKSLPTFWPLVDRPEVATIKGCD